MSTGRPFYSSNKGITNKGIHKVNDSNYPTDHARSLLNPPEQVQLPTNLPQTRIPTEMGGLGKNYAT